VQDHQGNLLRRGPFARNFNLLDHNLVARAQPKRRLSADTVDLDVAGVNRPLQRGSAKCWQLLC
jgi:hypothetical protein